MYQEECLNYVRTYAQPEGLDIELARQIILDHLHVASQSTSEPLNSSQLLSAVLQQKHKFDKPATVKNGYEPLLEDTLSNIKAELAAREALLSLHLNGVVIAYGGLQVSTDGHSPIQKQVMFNSNRPYPYNTQPESLGAIDLPSVHFSYRLAALFREDQTFRLASGDIYLASLDYTKLPSRAKRCLRECVDAFKHGLYLSATMLVGATSESLWMRLAFLLVSKKPSATNSLKPQLERPYPSISSVIKEGWQALVSHFTSELKQVFSNEGEKTIFKDHADRLCERRNYAIHREEADEEEPFFTRNETGMLLLASVNYFNQLIKLVAIIDALP